MKKVLILALVALSFSVNAQITTPRFGTTPGRDNTGRVLTYGYLAPDYAASYTVVCNAYETTMKMGTLTGALTLTATVTNCHVADKLSMVFVADGTNRVVTFSTGFASGGNITVNASTKMTVNFVFNGVGWVQQTANDLVFGLAGDGTVGAPSIGFTSDDDNGLYRIGANNYGASVGGSKVVDFTTSGIAVTGVSSASTYMEAGNGTAGAPAFSFLSDLDNGMYRIGANNVGISAGGTKILDIASTGLAVTGNVTTTTGNIRKNTATAINVTGTATAAQLAGGLLTSTSAAAVTITLPTATDLGTQLGAAQGTIFEFVVDNSAGANTVTIAVGAGITASGFPGTNTLTVPASASIGTATFRIVFMSSTTATLARIS